MNGESLPNDCYREPEIVFTLKQAKLIDAYFSAFCRFSGIDESKVQKNTESLKDIVVRIDQRRLYFHIYHNNMKPNEYKLFALLIYWTLKLRPFWIPIKENFSRESAKVASQVNENFCVFLVVTLLKKFQPQAYRNLMNSDYLQELAYSFRFRDLSKESIYLIFDSLQIT